MKAMKSTLHAAPGLRPSAPTCTSIVYRSSNVPFSPSAKRFASCPCLTRSSTFGALRGSPGTDVGSRRRALSSGRTLARGALALAFVRSFHLLGFLVSGKDKKTPLSSHSKPGGTHGQKPRCRREKYLSCSFLAESSAARPRFPVRALEGEEHTN